MGSRVPGSKPDAYFDPKAEDILSSYFLAAALGGLPITQVYLWVTEQVNREPINILKAHDYELQYKGLESTLELADKQRDGIFGTARENDPMSQEPEHVALGRSHWRGDGGYGYPS
ncbi:hypothetical protein QN084_23755 (plasmid) [Paenarthrobacter sp. R1]|uniref:hypothetical protein n=1 Tax=Paenarthrobacter sp. R1 TaxID=3049085 RepID=UPI002555E8F5|nr:hypothetical protein [Paenarthrobacter sp. R1]WIV33618.1 hypothetical protein QN084_23755 [Paenarthrobacter sp. R1]